MVIYQLAFFTPGRFPASALIRNWYCDTVSTMYCHLNRSAYPSKPEVAEDTTALAAHYAPVLDLCEACVAVHLGELELGLGADSLRERGVADDVPEGLPVPSLVVTCHVKMQRRIPFWLILAVRLPLRVVANVANLREASNVEFFGSAELRHDGV
jgi:hypothetical protein